MHTVLSTSVFDRQAQKAGLSEDDRWDIENYFSENPKAGDLIPGTGGARKVRFAGKGKGKRGGYRTIHYYGGDDVPVFLLGLLSKGQRSDLSQSDRNQLAKLLPSIGEEYKKGVAAKIVQMRRR